MQVSWIEPDDIAALAESLRPSARPAPAKETPVLKAPEQSLVQETPALETVHPAPVASAPADTSAGLPDLAAFRRRLQSIREKAINAGLLTPQPAAPITAAPAPIPSPAPEPLSEPISAALPVITPPSAPGPESVPVKETSPLVVSAPEDPTPPIPWVQETAVPPGPAVPETPPAYAPSPVDERHFTRRVEMHVTIASGSSVKERLDAFVQWAAKQEQSGDLLIVDEFGDLLWGPPAKSGLVLSIMMAWNAAIRASAQAASGVAQVLRQSLPTGQMLTLIPCQTRLGLLQIAQVTAQPPADSAVLRLQEALVQVMDMPG